MDTKNNTWTTVLGIIAGIVNYLVSVGDKMPTTKSEWGSLAFSAILAGLGYKAKDAVSGDGKK